MKRRGKERAEGKAEESCPGVNTALQPWSEMNERPSVRDRQTNNCFPSVLTSPQQAPGPPSLLYFISPNPKRGAEMNSCLQNFAEEGKKKENTVACSGGEVSSKERRESGSLSSCAKD